MCWHGWVIGERTENSSFLEAFFVFRCPKRRRAFSGVHTAVVKVQRQTCKDKAGVAWLTLLSLRREHWDVFQGLRSS